MSFIVSAKPQTPLIPEGSYPAVCCGLVDIGTQHVNYKDAEKEQKQITVMWELVGETIERPDGTSEARAISKTYTKSLSERSSLYKDLVSWRGREFTAEEMNAFDLRSVLGAPCLLSIVHRKTDNGTYANISGIMRLPRGMEPPKGERKALLFDVEDCVPEELARLPEWLQKRVRESAEWKAKDLGAGDFVDAGDFTDDDGEVPF